LCVCGKAREAELFDENGRGFRLRIKRDHRFVLFQLGHNLLAFLLDTIIRVPVVSAFTHYELVYHAAQRLGTEFAKGYLNHGVL